MSHAPSEPYVVVARRYRPQTFEELIGQEHVAKALTGAIAAGRVGHAYLFTGARGVGKTSAARILAKALNCVEGPTDTPCNACEICESVAVGEDIDVIEIDGASNRGIDEIRQLRQNVAVRPSRVRFKIYIIDEVHMLTKEAFNALLKTLEEPPQHVKFIFATTEPHKLPITILSRCQRFDFAGIDSRAIEHRLAQIAEAEGVDAEAEALAILARRANGSMRDGQSLLEQLLAGCREQITTEVVTDLLGIAPAARVGKLAALLAGGHAADALTELDATVTDGTDVGMLLEQIHGFFRDALVAAVGCGDDQFRHALPSQAEQVGEIAKELGPESILAVLQILDHAIGRLRLGVDVRTLVEMALVRICRLEDLDTIAGLVADLRSAPASGTTAAGKASASPSRSRRTAAKSAAGSKTGSKKNARPRDVEASRPKPLPPHAAPSRQHSAPPPSPPEPAPEQQTAVTDGSLVAGTEATADEVWQRALDDVGGLVAGNAAMASRVETAAGAGGDARLVVYFDEQYTTCKEFCDRDDHRQRLEAALSAARGGGVVLEFVTEAIGRQAVGTQPHFKSRREIKREVGERPFVQRAIELFGVEPGKLDYTPQKNDE
jgi:DNA polymerase-3 subunit gamma/tau